MLLMSRAALDQIVRYWMTWNLARNRMSRILRKMTDKTRKKEKRWKSAGRDSNSANKKFDNDCCNHHTQLTLCKLFDMSSLRRLSILLPIFTVRGFKQEHRARAATQAWGWAYLGYHNKGCGSHKVVLAWDTWLIVWLWRFAVSVPSTASSSCRGRNSLYVYSTPRYNPGLQPCISRCIGNDITTQYSVFITGTRRNYMCYDGRAYGLEAINAAEFPDQWRQVQCFRKTYHIFYTSVGTEVIAKHFCPPDWLVTWLSLTY